jgi:hypothetical protein
MSDRRKRLSALSWFIVAGLLVRAASGGGGGLGGFLYVAREEPGASYAAGVVLFAVALVLAFGFATSRSGAIPRLSAVSSVLTVLYGAWWYLLDDHTSGLALGAAGVAAFALAPPVALRKFVEKRVNSLSRRGAEPLERER